MIGWPALALAFVCFAAAGAADTTIDASARTIGAAATAAVGCVALAAWASEASRTAHATLALGCWLVVLALAAVHALVPGSAGATAAATAALDAATWVAILGAVVSTVYLGCREYGAMPPADSADDVLDGDHGY